jgi:hypothetical protein
VHAITLVFDAEPRMEEAIKWNRITFTVHGDWRDWICGIETTKKQVNVVFHKGALLNDRSGVLQGAGKQTRQIGFASLAEIESNALIDLIREAVTKQTDMIGDSWR